MIVATNAAVPVNYWSYAVVPTAASLPVAVSAVFRFAHVCFAHETCFALRLLA